VVEGRELWLKENSKRSVSGLLHSKGSFATRGQSVVVCKGSGIRREGKLHIDRVTASISRSSKIFIADTNSGPEDLTTSAQTVVSNLHHCEMPQIHC
jgi:hypothetical protein